MEPKIIFENELYLGVDKPAGLIVHADGHEEGETLVDWLMTVRPDIRGVGEPQRLVSGEVIERPGIVHRIDRDTSGVLVVAKTQEAFEDLKKKFQDRLVSKEYRALCHGKFSKMLGTIDRPIGRSRKDFRLWSAQRFSRGKQREAITDFTVLGLRPEATYVKVEPKTGRTHQIRVHLKAINHPVIGDSLYAPNHAPLFGFTRLALHSHKLSFESLSGERIILEAALPRDFLEALEKWPFESVAPPKRAW